MDSVAVGIRIISNHALVCARADAAAHAWRMHPAVGDDDNRMDSFNDALLHEIITTSLTDPNDVTKLHFRNGVEGMRSAFSSEGLKSVYDIIERFKIESSPTYREMNEDDIELFPDLLPYAAVIQGLKGTRVRRLLAFCVDELKSMALQSE